MTFLSRALVSVRAAAMLCAEAEPPSLVDDDFADIRYFNTVLSGLKTVVAMGDEQAIASTAKQLLPKLDHAIFQKDWSVDLWVRKHWPLLKDREAQQEALQNVRTALIFLRKKLRDSEYMADVTFERAVGNLTSAMDDYSTELNKFLKQITPERFEYAGFKIHNPDHLPEPTVRKLLSGIDYVVDLFKERGCSPLLHESIRRVVLREAAPAGRDYHGLYEWEAGKGVITMVAVAAGQETARYAISWVHDVFLHEVGHHVHLHLMDPEAARLWNSGWQEVRSAEKWKDEQHDKVRSVTWSDRTRFYRLLRENKADLKKIKRLLQPLDQMKFHAWLSKPLVNNALVTPHRWQWSKEGQDVRDMIADPEAFGEREYPAASWDGGVNETEKRMQHRWRQLESKLGVTDSYKKESWPRLDLDDIREYAADDNAIKQAVEELGLPSEYAKKNEMEDFAETFVAYMLDPSSISKKARFRMQQALSMSRLYNRPITKFGANTTARW